MNKTQKILLFLKSDLGFSIILFFIIILFFSFLSPKVSVQLFAFKRAAVLNDFINDTKANGINPQKYWKFREFYSPGYFSFSKYGIKNTLLERTTKQLGINYNEQNIDLTFLVFTSPRVNSLDMLTTHASLSKIIDKSELSKKDIIFMNGNTLIYRENTANIKIAFLLNNTEMKEANGFLDYQDKDKKLTEGKNWFNITSIKTN